MLKIGSCSCLVVITQEAYETYFQVYTANRDLSWINSILTAPCLKSGAWMVGKYVTVSPVPSPTTCTTLKVTYPLRPLFLLK